MMIDFPTFYAAIRRQRPFRWQQQLSNDMVSGKIPSKLSLPPATGKTSIIDIWFWALVTQILSEKQRTIPLRCWFVVDRRLLVDQAYAKAKKLKAGIDREIENNTVIGKWLSKAAKKLGLENILHIFRIRGGLDRREKNKIIVGNETMLPQQPAIISSTVDQCGSRLLFRGYGVSTKMRSMAAAMAAIDSFIIVDEAHISEPFVKLVKDIILQPNHISEVLPASHLLEMSATIENKDKTYASIWEDPSLRQRLHAVKKIKLAKSGSLVKHAKDALKKVALVAVVCNTVAKARALFEEAKKDIKTILLTGRIRGYERKKILKKYQRQLEADENRKGERSKLLVICTQAIEVGADFDFEAMITECAPWDALAQRFGRLDRLGLLKNSEGVIVAPGADVEDKIYREKSSETWKYLTEKYGSVIDDWNKLLRDGEDRSNLYSYKRAVVPLLPTMLDQLAHTNPHFNVDLDLLLHGADDSPGDLAVIFRNIDEDLFKNEKYHSWAAQWMKLCPPHNLEIVPVPISQFHIKLTGKKGGKYTLGSRPCLRYRDLKVMRIEHCSRDDLIIVPVGFGHHDKWGWNLESFSKVEDIYDILDHKILRLHESNGFDLTKYVDLGELREEDDKKLYRDLLHRIKDDLPGRLSDLHCKRITEKIDFLLDRKNDFSFDWTPDDSGLVFRGYEMHKKSTAQSLEDHLQEVGDEAYRLAKLLGLSKGLQKIVREAGLLHDIGKADPRFQEMLYAPRPVGDVLLAKSSVMRRGSFMQRAPRGWRHELQSVEMLCNAKIDCSDFDLLVHLVGSHHGWFRNSYRLHRDSFFKKFSFKKWTASQPYFNLFSRGNLDRFWELNKKYGYWGLAYLELLVRAADGLVSSRLEKGNA